MAAARAGNAAAVAAAHRARCRRQCRRVAARANGADVGRGRRPSRGRRRAARQRRGSEPQGARVGAHARAARAPTIRAAVSRRCMWAVRNGEEAVVRRLVEGGADINITNADGATAMMLAIINDRFDLAAKLVGARCRRQRRLAVLRDGNARRDDGLARARRFAVARRSSEQAHGARSRQGAARGRRGSRQAGRGADAQRSMCCDPKANATPFYRAAVAADVEALKLMLAYEPDFAWVPTSIKTGPRQPGDTGGKTALMVAMNGGKGVGMAGGPGDIREGIAPPFREVSNRNPVDAVKLLLEAGADPERQDARRRLRAASRRIRRQGSHRARARRRRRGHGARRTPPARRRCKSSRSRSRVRRGRPPARKWTSEKPRATRRSRGVAA